MGKSKHVRYNTSNHNERMGHHITHPQQDGENHLSLSFSRTLLFYHLGGYCTRSKPAATVLRVYWMMVWTSWTSSPSRQVLQCNLQNKPRKISSESLRCWRFVWKETGKRHNWMGKHEWFYPFLGFAANSGICLMSDSLGILCDFPMIHLHWGWIIPLKSSMIPALQISTSIGYYQSET